MHLAGCTYRGTERNKYTTWWYRTEPYTYRCFPVQLKIENSAAMLDTTHTYRSPWTMDSYQIGQRLASVRWPLTTVVVQPYVVAGLYQLWCVYVCMLSVYVCVGAKCVAHRDHKCCQKWSKRKSTHNQNKNITKTKHQMHPPTDRPQRFLCYVRNETL